MSHESFPVPASTIRPILAEKSIVVIVVQVKQTVESGSAVAKPQYNAYIKKLEKEVGSVCDTIQAIAKKYTQIDPSDPKDVKLAKLKQSEEIIKFLESTRDFVSKFLARLITQVTSEGIEKCHKKINQTFQTFFDYFEK